MMLPPSTKLSDPSTLFRKSKRHITRERHEQNATFYKNVTKEKAPKKIKNLQKPKTLHHSRSTRRPAPSGGMPTNYRFHCPRWTNVLARAAGSLTWLYGRHVFGAALSLWPQCWSAEALLPFVAITEVAQGSEVLVPAEDRAATDGLQCSLYRFADFRRQLLNSFQFEAWRLALR